MKLLHACKTFLHYVLRDRSQTLEQYIVANNPQNTMHVEQLERQYYARALRGRMV